MRVNKETYRKVLQEDIKWLIKNTDTSHEREHVLQILWDSLNFYYPDASQPIIEADAEKPCKNCGLWEAHYMKYKKCQSCGRVFRTA